MTDHSPDHSWSEQDLALYGDAEEIEISTRRRDNSLRPFVPIWIVAVDGGLYVRSYRGTDGTWYRHATRDRSGVIRAGGQQVDVAVTRIDAQQPGLLGAIGQAYRAKYARYGNTYLEPMLAEQAVATTMRVDPTPET